jgi:hypothetical protein
MFAHALLAREKERAGDLAAECETLVQLTRELLEAAGLVHLLGAGGGAVPAADADELRQSRLTEAYAKAGLMWAQIAGSAMALGRTLIDAGSWDDAHHLAGFLEESGEKYAAEDLRARVINGRLRHLESRLARIHPAMTEPEIASAIEVLRESRKEDTVSIHIRVLALSILRIHPSKDFMQMNIHVGYCTSTIEWLASEGEYLPPGQRLATLYATSSPQAGRYDSIPFSDSGSILVKRLVSDGAEIATSAPVARLIKAPREINAIIEGPANDQKVFVQLETLAHIFGRIQIEHGRTRWRPGPADERPGHHAPPAAG